MGVDIKFSDFLTNGIRLHAAEAGPGDGPLVILLHGFPEFWYGWRHQIAPLAEAGFRVLAPDQRGYHLSDKPGRIADYALDTLAADVLGLIDAVGREKAALVGHDWGGIVTWWAAMQAPERLERIAVLNAPHPLVFRRSLLHNPRQLLRSWYAFWFQVPWLPEALLGRRNGLPLARALTTTSRPGTFGEPELEAYRRAWSQPGALKAMIHWYRASLLRPPKSAVEAIDVPTLLIWAVRDRFLGRELARPSIERCREGRLELIEEATHWVQHEEPERVNRLLLDFFKAEGPSPG